MNDDQVQVIFRQDHPKSSRGTIVVQQDDQTLFSDKADIANARQRSRIIEQLTISYPGLEATHIEELLLNEVGRLTHSACKSEDRSQEIDVSHITRPQLFFTPDVSGVLIPGVKLVEGQLVGHWKQYLRWADGRRERRDLEQSIILSNDMRLWFSPMPSDPDVNDRTMWSRSGRTRWLQGYNPKIDEVLMSLMEVFNHFLVFREEEAKGHLAVLSLWTILSYVYPIWPAVPYLSVGGPLGSGKSRVFDVLSYLVLCPIISSNMTAPCMFRTLHDRGGTLLLDEAERLRDKGPEMAEIRSILLAGYKAGQKAQRLEKNGDSFNRVNFDVFSPKAVACISELPAALTSRCIRIMMFRAPKGSSKPSYQLNSWRHWARLRDDLHCLALNIGMDLLQHGKKTIACDGLYGRDMEIWSPILSLARFIESTSDISDLVTLVEQHAQHMVASQKEESMSPVDEVVLLTLVRLVRKDAYGVMAKQVLDGVKEEEPGMFNRYSARGISAVLKRYGLRSTRIGGKNLFRPSDTDLLTIQESYGIDLGQDEGLKKVS